MGVSEFFSVGLSPMNTFIDVSKSVHGFYKAQYHQKLCFDDSLFVVAPIVLGLCFIVYFLLSFLVSSHLAKV